ncbi:aldose epimerase family protein [Acuticoccus sp.]|uniref:aldose epimerase family protein n=1 Tax=Acuticoccus sp. TaxID=1904378 RepID=UPI003B51B1EC
MRHASAPSRRAGHDVPVERFGTFRDEPVYRATLTSDAGVAVNILSYGAVIQSWTVPGADGMPRQATLGFEAFAPYPEHSRSFGIIAGRLANRVRDARFTLEGRTYALDRNKGRHHIHGGSEGFGRSLWRLDADDRAARLSLRSPDGAMGYPGAVDVGVEITLDEHAVTFAMTAVPDRATPIALAQHSYYRLGGPTREHRLAVATDRVTLKDADKVATGEVVPVDGTPLDFRTERPIGNLDLDDNFCLTGAAPAATLTGRDLALTLVTDRPGLQVYNAYDMPPVAMPGLDGERYGPRCAVALEAQDWPNAVNHEGFPSVVVTPDRPYRQVTAVTIVPA